MSTKRIVHMTANNGAIELYSRGNIWYLRCSAGVYCYDSMDDAILNFCDLTDGASGEM